MCLGDKVVIFLDVSANVCSKGVGDREQNVDKRSKIPCSCDVSLEPVRLYQRIATCAMTHWENPVPRSIGPSLVDIAQLVLQRSSEEFVVVVEIIGDG